jgi:hypothetical protein
MLWERIRCVIPVLASPFAAEHGFADDCSFLQRGADRTLTAVLISQIIFIRGKIVPAA